MRRAFRIAVLAGLVAAFLRHRRRAADDATTVSIGFADGSSTTVEDWSPQRELIVAAAVDALA